MGELYAFYAIMKLCVFIERDGILNRVRVERQHQVTPLTLQDFHVNLAIAAPLNQLKAAGFMLIATTNQPGVSRGVLSRRELDRMHDMLMRTLPLDDVLVCPHDESDQCSCRKPGPGLLIEAGFKWLIDLDRSFVVSHKWQDADAARLAGCTSLLIESPWSGAGHRDFLLSDFASATRKIIHLQQSLRELAF
jgi:D-glycero-D-manno-heptose 1,7-bisphosphate phosphatase